MCEFYRYWKQSRDYFQEALCEPVSSTIFARDSGIDERLFLAMPAESICKPVHLHIRDEPMNYIDVVSRMQIEELLLRFQPTIPFVEHDKAFCENVATKIVVL